MLFTGLDSITADCGHYLAPRKGKIIRIKVKLDDIITGMESQTDEMSSYLNKETGEVSTVMDQESQVAEEEDDSLISMYGLSEDGIETALDILMDDKDRKYIALPSKFEIDMV